MTDQISEPVEVPVQGESLTTDSPEEWAVSFLAGGCLIAAAAGLWHYWGMHWGVALAMGGLGCLLLLRGLGCRLGEAAKELMKDED